MKTNPNSKIKNFEINKSIDSPKSMNNIYQKIILINYLPLNAMVKLDDSFRIKMFNKAIKKAGTKAQDLADKIGIKYKEKINEWRRGRIRIKLDYLLKIANYLNIPLKTVWLNIIGFGLQGEKGYSINLPYFLEINEDIAWLLGFYAGDGGKTKQINICSSQKEIDSIIRFKKIFNKMFILYKNWTLYLYHKNSSFSKQLKKYFKGDKIVYYKHFHNNSDEGYILLNYFSSLLGKILNNLDLNFDEILNKSPLSVKGAYLKGFSDAEGCVDIHGNIVIIQNISGIRFVQRAENILKNLNIKFRTKNNRNRLTLIIYSLSDFKNKIGFKCRRKQKELNQILNCYNKDMDFRDLKKIILNYCKLPKTKKQIMIKFNIKYGKLTNLLHKLFLEKELKLLNIRPYTVIQNG